MSLVVQFSPPNKICFEDYPNAPLSYRRVLPQSSVSYLRLKVTDKDSNKKFNLFVQKKALENIGISVEDMQTLKNKPDEQSAYLQSMNVKKQLLNTALSIVAPHMDPTCHQIFQDNILLMNQVLGHAILNKVKHVKHPIVPGMYLDRVGNIFINLIETKFASGTFGNVKKALCLNTMTVVAKKVLKDVKSKPDQEDFNSQIAILKEMYQKDFTSEIAILKELRHCNGIIHPISAGDYDGKTALFMPLYDCDLFQFYTRYPLNKDQLLSVVRQLLEGLQGIERLGVHGDLSPNNVLFVKTHKRTR